MGTSTEQLEDYRKRTLSFLQFTKECIPMLTDTGLLIQTSYKDIETPRYMVFCHDIIKRVRENLCFLINSNPPQKHNSIPLQIILRSVFNDLISLTYVVENLGQDTIITSFLSTNDMKAVEGKQEYAECEKEFLSLCEKSEWITFLDDKIEDLSNTHKEIVAPFGSKKALKRSTPTATKTIAESFNKKTSLKPFYAFLFGPFKMLSQVEHYANENRSYSYFDLKTAFFFEKFAWSYKLVIECLCKNIASYIQNLKN